MALRWLLTTRNSMQRIGFLYFVCSLASRSTPTTSELLGRKLREAMEKPTQVVWTEVETYFERHKLFAQRYKNHKPPLTAIEYQDKLLSDSRLPSSTGAVTDKVYTDLVDEAVQWGLIRQRTNTLTDRGAALLRLWEMSMSETGNPLLLDDICRAACTYWYLDVDGDALRAAYAHLEPERFSREELGEAIALGIDDLLANRPRLVAAERASYSRLKSLAHSIRNPIGKTIGSGRAVFQASTLRAEHPVDLGLLTKDQPWINSYKAPADSPLRRIPEKLESFLQSGFASSFGPLFRADLRESTHDMRWDFFLRSYRTLRNALGYASLRESAILGYALALKEGYLAEVSSIVDSVITNRASRNIRIAIGRSGKPEFVKVEDA